MPQFKYLNDKDLWMLAEDIPDVDFFFCQIWLSCFVNEFAQPGGRAYKKILSVHKGYHQWFYFGEKDSEEVGEHLVSKFLEIPEFVKKINQEIVEWADKLRKYTESLPETNLNKYANKQLWEFCKKHDEIHTKYYQWSWIPVACDMFHSNLTDKLKSYLKNTGLFENQINEHFILLTQPTQKSLIQKEHEEFLKIAIKIQKDKYHKQLFKKLFQKFQEQKVAQFGYQTHSLEYENLFEKTVEEIKDKIKPAIYKIIQEHYKKYFYVNHMWVGEVSSFEHYLKELVRIIGAEINVEEQYKKEQKEFFSKIKQRNNLIKKLKITKPWITLFNGFGDFMVTKIYRRFAQIYALYKIEYILQEISKRLNLSLMEVRFMLPEEMKKALLEKKINRQEIKKRKKFCVYYVEKNKDEVFVGEKAKKIAKTVERKMDKTPEIKGQTGCVGKAIGVVKIIFRPKDMTKMKKGDILVSIATDPDIVPAMKKASAIVTEQGGVTSHAAIVSRELNIPCVIGTKIATKVLKDGQLVEVDANKGIVKIIKE